MRLRTFTAPDMPAAMKLVRETLGDDAVILTVDSRGGKGLLTITAAADDDDEPLPLKPTPKYEPPMQSDPVAGELRYELQNLLRFHNLPELFVAKMMQRASDSELAAILGLHRTSANRSQGALRRLATEKLTGGYFAFDPLRFDGKDSIMLIGQPGIGKTLSIAKIAAKLVMEGRPLSVVTTDTQRAGGVEQLQAFTQILGIPLHVADGPDELRKLLKAHGRLLIDTAGCNPYNTAELTALKAVATLPGVEPVLTMQAGGDSLEAVDVAELFATLPIKRLLLTRADTARRFGGAMAAAAAHGLAFSHVSRSASVADPLEPVNASLLAQLLLAYQSQNG